MNIKIVKEESFRSKPLINMDDDMVRVTLDMSKNDWHMLKRQIDKKIVSGNLWTSRLKTENKKGYCNER